MARRNVKAWLITWEGDHGREDNVAMLLHPATAESRVAGMMELLYANQRGTLAERLVYAIERDPALHPYRSRVATRGGREDDGHLLCGDDPYLYARRVEHVTVGRGEEEAEALRWTET